MQFDSTEKFARECDLNDPLSGFRDRFYIPVKDGKETIYFCGNSLGLQCTTVREYLETELRSWEKLGVEGHFRGANPWADYHWLFKENYSELLGAMEDEVVVMNSLTANLHMMMVSFYRPEGKKKRILMEAGAFPSDQYAVESQVWFHGHDPAECIIELEPRTGEEILRTEDILTAMEKYCNELALVLLPGVQYYTGQYFNISSITRAAHDAGALIGWDLAHAVGNVPLNMHEWGADFGVWCSYKYLNSGPGGIGGIFVHERHSKIPDLPRFAGWWGHKAEERFLMKKGFIPMEGADGWQLSNKNILSLAAQKASLEVFREAGIRNLRDKSLKLTSYLEYLIRTGLSGTVSIITPSNPEERGCQLSMVVKNGKQVFNELTDKGIITDWREPDVIRVAPVPLYNRFMDVYQFFETIRESVNKERHE